MGTELDAILETLHAKGYDSVTRTEAVPDEADGVVSLPEKHRREPKSRWRRLLSRPGNEANPDLVPDDLRSVVEGKGWTVQPMGREEEAVYVVISENGV